MYHDLINTFLTFSVLSMLMSVAIDFNATKQRHQKKIFFCACFSLFFFWKKLKKTLTLFNWCYYK